jgi:uncharacterized protein (DUF983 family)
MPSAAQLIGRALRRRCPVCGQGHLFVHWFRIRDRCPRCGLPFEREPGFFLGAMAINYSVAAAAFIALLIVWLAATLPDPPVLWITLGSLGLTAAVVLLFYPFSKTLWVAIDVLLHHMDPEDLRSLMHSTPREPAED